MQLLLLLCYECAKKCLKVEGIESTGYDQILCVARENVCLLPSETFLDA
jgi:hypothetical protein